MMMFYMNVLPLAFGPSTSGHWTHKRFMVTYHLAKFALYIQIYVYILEEIRYHLLYIKYTAETWMTAMMRPLTRNLWTCCHATGQKLGLQKSW